ncbi:MAG: hypothetical protein MUC87_07820 [Bacteroidia bacterium]|jgi:hypothetical protein|nr:hypothetical protein [Bacteroidia bacterium]
MRIQSNDIPQADRIESVLAATFAVANGATTDIDIANQVPGIEGDSRQGRYYRRAAEILGFLTNNRNNASITSKGLLIADNPTLSNPILLESVLNLNLYQKLLPYLELHPTGLSRQQIINYLELISEQNIGSSMIPRRISTILAWIRTLGIIEYVNDQYRISKDIIPNIPLIHLNDIEQPVLPRRGNLEEYEVVERRIKSAQETIIIYKNQAKLDRANQTHTQLVNLVAEKIRMAGGIPKSNQFIDVAATLEQDFIFEMKSTTEKNVKAQIRKGISQLYEYRYLENKPHANLVLVVEKPLINDNNWMIDYLEVDRNIHIIWDGDGNLYGTERTRELLGFLSLHA